MIQPLFPLTWLEKVDSAQVDSLIGHQCLDLISLAVV